MRYRKLGSSDMEVSVVSLGTWVSGGDQWGETDDSHSIAAIRKAIDAGINLIDTAPAYGLGHAEKIVGEAIRGRRDEVFIATKCGLQKRGKKFVLNLQPAEIRKELEESLARLRTEKIDLYQCHWPDPKTSIESTLEEMERMKSEGKIGDIGVSNFDLPLLKKAARVAHLASVQPHYSLLERGIEKDILPFCTAERIGVITYGSLGSGVLSGKYQEKPSFKKNDARSYFYRYYKEPNWSPVRDFIEELEKIAAVNKKPTAQVAINWILQREGVTSAIVGARTIEQVVTNAGAADWALPPDDIARIDQVHKRVFPTYYAQES
jgi:aryl-alcohol dehydrogenase-like predicted oxidoreductase